jgi:protein-tyrosine phosphatase
MTRQDYTYYNYIIAMDRNNLRNLKRMFGEDTEYKISLLMDYTHRPGDVADPWYTGDFEATWVDVMEGCKGLLAYLKGR